MYNFATLSDSTLLTLGTKIQKNASEGNQHGIEKISKACEFSHQYVKTLSERATNAVSQTPIFLSVTQKKQLSFCFNRNHF